MINASIIRNISFAIIQRVEALHMQSFAGFKFCVCSYFNGLCFARAVLRRVEGASLSKDCACNATTLRRIAHAMLQTFEGQHDHSKVSSIKND